MGLHSAGTVLSKLGCSSGSHSDLSLWSVSSREEGISPLALVFVTGSMDEQRNKSSNCLGATSFASLHGAQTTCLPFLSQLLTSFFLSYLSTTYFLTSHNAQLGTGPPGCLYLGGMGIVAGLIIQLLNGHKFMLDRSAFRHLNNFLMCLDFIDIVVSIIAVVIAMATLLQIYLLFIP